jgi:hypothetical protein
VAISDPATAQITTHKNLGNSRIAYKPRQTHARTHARTHLNTISQKKHRWQLVTQLLTDHNTQRGQNTNTKHTQTHNGTQTKSIQETTTQRFGNWFCFRHQVKTSEGDLLSYKCPGSGSDSGCVTNCHLWFVIDPRVICLWTCVFWST